MKLGLLVALAVMLLSGCNTTVQQKVYTSSGMPEAVIAAPVAAIKSEIVADLVRYGYNVEHDTDYSLRLVRGATGGENFAVAMSMGNASSSNSRVINYTFVREGNAVRVIVGTQMRADMPGGQTRTGATVMQPQMFNTYWDQLQTIKKKLEAIPAGKAT